MHRGADPDAGFCRKTAGKTEHLGTVGLHREVLDRAGVHTRPDVDPPAEYAVKRPIQHSGIQRRLGPAPEGPVSPLVECQQFPSSVRRLSNLDGEGLCPHAVLHCKGAGLELFANLRVGCLGGILRDSARLNRKGEIGVARKISLLHGAILGKRRCNPKLLLRPVDVRKTPPRLWADQPPQPHRRTEDEFLIARLVPPGSCPEC